MKMDRRVLLMFFLSLLAQQVSAKEIAITFDDAPRSGSAFMSMSNACSLFLSMMER